MLFEMPEFVEAMRTLFAKEVSPQMSYAVQLRRDGTLFWEAESDGAPARFETEPEASFGRRLLARGVGWLPLESQL